MIMTKKKELIINLYLQKNLSQRDLEKKLKISRTSIRFCLDKLKIKKSKLQIKQSMKRTFFKKGHKINLGKKNALGYEHTPKEIEMMSGENSGRWKGNKVGYSGSHSWLSKQFGKAKICEFNNFHIAKRFEWANSNHSYSRKREDYIQLCPSCHRKFDLGKIKMEKITNV